MRALALDAAEAGYVLDRSIKAIHKAVDAGVIRARTRRVGNVVQRLLGSEELRYLMMAGELRDDLTLVGQKRLYEAVRALPADAHRLQIGKLEVDLAHVDAELSRRVERLQVLRDSVETRDDEVVIKGSGVPVHLVAALARGQTIDEVVEDYPQLSPDQVRTAAEYAKAFPKRGRPYPIRSFKRMIADAAAVGVFDDESNRNDGRDVEPFLIS